ncbi:MAG TPA: antitoxin Xre/MbcA/ParS toxin-binding domain-containing protein [Anaeromyxobacteraceae bacterium]|nr:antitoxin Xre/MbcA/ParS toxin-binding domain-containing protein [Anaeromyxobacteraceae bacterium]
MAPPAVTHEQALRRARAVFRTEQAARAWYTLPNPRLGDSPRSIVERGEGERVLAELEQLPPAQPSILGFPADRLWGRRR